jgi:hypothetical protein
LGGRKEGPDSGLSPVTLQLTRQVTRRGLEELSGSDRMPCGGRLVLPLGASGHGVRVWALLLIDASGQLWACPVITSSHGRFRTLDIDSQHSNTETCGGRSVTERWGAARPVTLTSASSHPDNSEVQGANGYISWGLLFKPYG